MADTTGFVIPSFNLVTYDDVPLERSASTNILNLDTLQVATGRLVDATPELGTVTGNFPDEHITRNHTGFRLSGINDIFYNRIIVEPTLTNVGNVSADRRLNVNVFNAFFTTSNLLTIDRVNADGIELMPDDAPRAFGPLVSQTYVVTITSSGPPTIDASLVFDFDTGDGAASFVGSRTIGFPYLFGQGTTETLLWNTQVMTSVNGSEQRVRVRNAPRHEFNTVSYVPRELSTSLKNLLYGWRINTFGVPLSMECRNLTSPTIVDSAVIQVVTAYGRFAVGGLIMLYESPTKTALLQVASFTADSITVTQDVGAVFSSSTILMPVVPSFVATNPARQTNGYQSNVEVFFRATENEVIDSAPSTVQYKGEDVYLGEQLLGGNYAPEIYRSDLSTIDFETGAIGTYSEWENTKIQRPVLFQLRSLQEVWEFRRWLHRRGGRQRPVWLPTLEEDFTVIGPPLIDDIIEVQDEGQLAFLRNRVNIAINIGGTWVFREITAINVKETGVLNLTINETLGSIPPSEVSFISYFDRRRLASDRVELLWTGNFTAEATVTLVNVE